MTPETKQRAMWVVVLVLVGVAYAAGRYTAPDKVVEKKVEVEKKIEVARDTEETKALVASLREELSTIKSRIHRQTKTTILPDGTRTREKTEQIDTDVSKDDSERSAVEIGTKTDSTKATETDKTTVSVKEVERERPRFRIGPTITYDIPSRAFAPGGEAQVRIIGPVSGSVNVNSRPAVTLGVSLEF